MAEATSVALAALLADPPGTSSPVVVAATVPREHCDISRAERIPDEELPDRLRGSARPTVVVLARVTPALQRALLENPPALVVLTDAIDPSLLRALEALPDTVHLGPHASLATGSGALLACAADCRALLALQEALGVTNIRLAVAPTPAWFVSWLADDRLARHPVAGTILGDHLGLEWALWARERGEHQVLVPLGLSAPALDRPQGDALARAVAAHALERLTGPVFPDPRVIALVTRGLVKQSATPSATALATWAQARRALPMTGALLEMEAPSPGLDLADPTVSFLAQRAILRRKRCERLTKAALDAPASETSDKQERAHEVLASAGQVLSDHESKVVLRGFGIEITRQAVATSASGAGQFAETIGLPVVLKAVSPDLRRKQEIGAVCLDLPTAAAVRRAYGTIARNVATHAPTARLDGVVVAEMIGAGTDLHCGGFRMPTGDIALYGRALVGPAALEPIFGLCPMSGHDALLLADAILTRLPVPALRRETDPDIHLLGQLFLRLDRLFRDTGERLLQVELNPVRLEHAGRRCVTLDARMVQRPHLEGS